MGRYFIYILGREMLVSVEWSKNSSILPVRQRPVEDVLHLKPHVYHIYRGDNSILYRIHTRSALFVISNMVHGKRKNIHITSVQSPIIGCHITSVRTSINFLAGPAHVTTISLEPECFLRQYNISCFILNPSSQNVFVYLSLCILKNLVLENPRHPSSLPSIHFNSICVFIIDYSVENR